jgi:hypothetical protein
MFRDLLALLAPEIDGTRAWDNAAAIHARDRNFTFSSFHESARWSADRLRAAGLAEVEILEAPADGKSVFGDWMMPLSWEADKATFDLIAPDGSAERLADRAETPACLAMWSAPTPADGVAAELIHLEKPDDGETWTTDQVRGKIVFSSAHPHTVKKVLLEAGAVGLLSDFQSPGANLPDAVSWINAWSDDPGGWAVTGRDARGWSFQIPPRQGEQLRARLCAGEKLRGRAFVRASIEPGTLPAVTGVIPGSGREEVLLLGHQFEQGMVDNAGGVGLMIEVARSLQSLISEGKLPAPERPIRFLFMSECYSTLHWVETARRARRTAAGLCIDGPCGAAEYATKPLEFSLNPLSQMTYADALILAVAREAMADNPLHAWSETPFAMGTDNMIADSHIAIPCPWIGSQSRTWHNSADVPEVLDAEAQELVARIAAAYAYLIAAPDANRALDFAHLAAARGKTILADASVREMEARSERDLDDSLGQIVYLAERQAEAVGSALKLLPSAERAGIRSQVRALQRDVRRVGKDEAASLARRAGQPGRTPASPHLNGELGTIHPRRLVPGPLTFDRLMPADREGRPSPRWSGTLFAILSWCNGRRSLAEASHLAARELRRDHTLSPDELIKEVDPGAPSLLDYFEFLRRHDYVTW